MPPMSITTMTVHIEPGSAAALEAALATPLAVAEAHAAHLTALVFHAETELTAATMASWDLAAREESAVAHVRDAAARRGVACEIRARSSFGHGAGEVFADHLRVSDLGLLTLAGAPAAGGRMLIAAAVFGSGRPVLLVPAHAPLPASPARVVVAWDATPAAVRAVHGALPFIRVAAETLVVTVTDDKELRPGQSGIELTRLLARHGARASFAAVQRGGRGVLEALEATAGSGPDALLVMGACRHSPLRSMIFGSATGDLLGAGPPLPVLLAA
jgi:nucleotide-binding universal stress UspA family protein